MNSDAKEEGFEGDEETAERMCMEVIRQDPTAPQPFQTLATLYEEQGEIVWSVGCSPGTPEMGGVGQADRHKHGADLKVM